MGQSRGLGSPGACEEIVGTTSRESDPEPYPAWTHTCRPHGHVPRNPYGVQPEAFVANMAGGSHH
jgi:hypothetical protein